MNSNRILVGTDGSKASLHAVEWAAREATARGWPLRIASVPVVPPRMAWRPPRPERPEAVADIIRGRVEQALTVAADRASELEPGLAVSTTLLSGQPAQALADHAGKRSMLVVGSRGAGGLAALVLGSVSRQVALSARCPVVVAREETMAVRQNVVVGVRHPEEKAALSFAFEAARLRKARLPVIYAWELFRLAAPDVAGSPDIAGDTGPVTVGWLAELVAPWRPEYPDVEVVEEAACAAPGRVLVSAFADADLMVIGRPAPHYAGAPRTGAVTHAVLSHAHCPVAIIPE